MLTLLIVLVESSTISEIDIAKIIMLTLAKVLALHWNHQLFMKNAKLKMPIMLFLLTMLTLLIVLVESSTISETDIAKNASHGNYANIAKSGIVEFSII